MKITAKNLKTATKIEVSDGHPNNNNGTTVNYLKVDGGWYEDGDTREDSMTAGEVIKCWDILKIWNGEELVIDQKDEMIANWEA